jgi:copper chaperone CopZ
MGDCRALNIREGLSMTNTLGFIVTGEQKIHCEGCESRISNALKRLSGVRDVKASAQNQLVVVTVDPAEVGSDQVRARLEQLGYQVTHNNV